jgi:hypothetical protein
LESTQIAKAYDFAILNGIGYYIFEGYEHGIHIGLVDGTGGLDAFCHFAEADVATGLGLGIKFRWIVLFTGFGTRDY